MTKGTELFHRAHYNIIAAQIRRNFGKYDGNTPGAVTARAALTDLALSMAKRLKEDNPAFDPVVFLDQSTPNPLLYPLSELWEDYVKSFTV
jgi:hypothetical protein